MISLDEATAWLRGRLSESRFEHSVQVCAKATDLAQRFGFFPQEIEQVRLGALLHDAAKLMPPQEMIALCERHGMALTLADRQTLQTLHPIAGAVVVQQELGITDPLVLGAIQYHTTGCQGMNDVEKMVYIADKLIGNRQNPLFVQKITALFQYQDRASLDEAMLFLLDSTLTYLIGKGQVIHPRTVEARNDFVQRLHQKSLGQYTREKEPGGTPV